jgi:hypothetical protein
MTPSVLLSCAACSATPASRNCREALTAKRPPRDFLRQLAINYRQLAKIAGNPEIKQRMIDMAAHYQAKADEEADAKGEETIGGGRVSGGCANARA